MSHQRKVYTVVSFSPLPESLLRAIFAPYADKLDGELEFIVLTDVSDWEKVSSALRKADVVIGDYTFRIPIDEKMCKAMERVRLIQQPSTGFDHIDVDACARQGIPVANIGGANTISVAEYTVMAALALLRRLVFAHLKTSAGEWPQWQMMEMGTYEIDGKTWGVVGLGRIGREVARRARALGARVLYYDKVRPSREVEEELGVEYAPLPKLLRESDIVSIHVPLTPETRGMIGERELRLMKPTAVIINPARGEVVDEAALAKALEEGWIAGAAVDVYSTEPPPADHPLIKLAREGKANIIVTPHIAGATTDARARIIQVTAENVVRALRGEKPLNVVNMQL
ncbi:MAG: 2-hydroxyacid dehydrogenase [Thermoproteota archaeon]